MIAAIVSAAGSSRRMGMPKLTLPWGSTTVIGAVVGTLLHAGMPQIVIVTGGARAEVEAALDGLPVRTVHNPDYESYEMLRTFQVGLRAVEPDLPVEAALIVLGDQPQMEEGVVRAVIDIHRVEGAPLIVPSFHMRRGHPWLVHRRLWPEILALGPQSTLRDFLTAHASLIRYIPVESGSILKDLDTPDEYQRERPPV